jgi:hypothetical protein
MTHNPLTTPSIRVAGEMVANHDTDMGPAMIALSPRRRGFVRAYIENGGNARQAALAAGYAESSAGVHGANMAKEPKVQAAILELTYAYAGSNVPIWMAELNKIAMDVTVTPAARISAFKLLTNLGGLKTGHVTTVKHEHSLNERQMLETARQMEKEMGMAPGSLLKAHTKVVDAEFEVVDEQHSPIVTGTEGLEDLI